MGSAAGHHLRPAEVFELDGEMGTIEAGRLADLVLLRAKALDDVANTRNIEAVVTKGELKTRLELDALPMGR